MTDPAYLRPISDIADDLADLGIFPDRLTFDLQPVPVLCTWADDEPLLRDQADMGVHTA